MGSRSAAERTLGFPHSTIDRLRVGLDGCGLEDEQAPRTARRGVVADIDHSLATTVNFALSQPGGVLSTARAARGDAGAAR